MHVKSKKPIRSVAPPRRRPSGLDEPRFTVILEDLRAQFRVFGEAIQELPTRREMLQMRDELRDELRGELHGLRDELRTDIALLQTAVLDLSKRIP